MLYRKWRRFQQSRAASLRRVHRGALPRPLLAQRQGEGHRGALAGLALDVEGSAVHADQGLAEGEAEARALLGLGVLALHLFEGAGQALQVFPGDADAGVLHADLTPLDTRRVAAGA